MQIVPISESDAKELAELDRQCFSVPWSEKSFADESKNNIAVYFVAKIDGKIAGYAGFWHVADEGDITNIAVLPEYRRQGIASKLLEQLVLEAKERKLELLTLEVRESNASAIALYERFGFEKIGQRKRFYTNPEEDALIMTLYFGGIYG